MKVFLVIGHGVQSDGSPDCGCVDEAYTEAGLMKPIVGEAVSVLRSKGHEVFTDYPENQFNITVGTGKANAWGADVYVSLHCDYNKAPTGTLPIIYPGSVKGRKLAESINKSVTATMGIKTRGILERDDMEVSYTDMPACIFETGSIRADIDILKDAKRYGQAVANGILAYFGGATVVVPKATTAPKVTPVSTVLLKLGSRGSEVTQLQRDLRTLAYEDETGKALALDGVYGQKTAYAVKTLQRVHKLEVDGIYGAKSDQVLMGEVKKIQNVLGITADGAVGDKTLAAIRAYQKKHGLTADGIVGRKTAKAMGI